MDRSSLLLTGTLSYQHRFSLRWGATLRFPDVAVVEFHLRMRTVAIDLSRCDTSVANTHFGGC